MADSQVNAQTVVLESLRFRALRVLAQGNGLVLSTCEIAEKVNIPTALLAWVIGDLFSDKFVVFVETEEAFDECTWEITIPGRIAYADAAQKFQRFMGKLGLET